MLSGPIANTASVLQTVLIASFTLRFALWWRPISNETEAGLRWGRHHRAGQTDLGQRENLIHLLCTLELFSRGDHPRKCAVKWVCRVWKAKGGKKESPLPSSMTQCCLIVGMMKKCCFSKLIYYIFDFLMCGCRAWGWCSCVPLTCCTRHRVIPPLKWNHGECWHRAQGCKKGFPLLPQRDAREGADWWHAYLVTASITVVIFPLLH